MHSDNFSPLHNSLIHVGVVEGKGPSVMWDDGTLTVCWYMEAADNHSFSSTRFCPALRWISQVVFVEIHKSNSRKHRILKILRYFLHRLSHTVIEEVVPPCPAPRVTLKPQSRKSFEPQTRNFSRILRHLVKKHFAAQVGDSLGGSTYWNQERGRGMSAGEEEGRKHPQIFRTGPKR